MTAGAKIHDGGYRRYEGSRLGPRHAVRSLTVHTVERMLGLRRPARAKALPALIVAIAYLPAMVFIGVRATFAQPGANTLLEYHQYYGIIASATLLFLAFSAPESICTDRRTRSLSLYLASPLDRTSYLLAKWLAIVAVVLLVTVGPLLVLLIGYMVLGDGPDGPAGVALTLFRILASGASLAVILASVAAAVAAFATRMVASATILFGFLALGALADTLTDVLHWDQVWILISPLQVAFELVPRLYGMAPIDSGTGQLDVEGEPALGGLALVGAAWVVWTIATAVITWWRYQRLEVAR